MNNLQISWQKITLLFIPLCFIVDYITSLNTNTTNATVFMLVIFNYSVPFFSRREEIPTIFTLYAFYFISILGAFLILYTSMAWILLVILVLRIVYPMTTVTTEFGTKIYDKTDDELKDVKGIQLLATKTQRETNTRAIYDYVIFIVVGVLFLFVRDYING